MDILDICIVPIHRVDTIVVLSGRTHVALWNYANETGSLFTNDVTKMTHVREEMIHRRDTFR